MYRKKATWSSPVQNPKLQELDELASCVYTLLVPSFEELHRRFDGRRLPVKPAEIVAAVLPFVFDGSVPLHRVLGSHEAVKAGLLRLVADASGGRPTLMFDVFRAALMEGHTRHFERCSQRPVTKWRRSAATVPLPDIEQAVPLASGMLCLCDSDSEHERFRILRSPANGGNWTVDGDAAAVLTAKLEGYTSACAVTEANGFPVFSQVDNLGASLVFVDPAGKVLHHGALASHATVLRWIPQMQRLAVGSALGDLSLWTCNGRQDPDTYIGHNGPVVNVGHLDLSGLLGTVGADGKAALVDPLSMTEVRSTTADEAFRCGAFSAAFNLVAAGGSSSNPLLVNASLPLRAKFEPLEDDVAPHEYVVVDVLFHRDQLASLDARGIVKLWDLRMFRCVETLSTATQRDTVMERLHQLGPDLLAVSGSATVVLQSRRHAARVPRSAWRIAPCDGVQHRCQALEHQDRREHWPLQRILGVSNNMRCPLWRKHCLCRARRRYRQLPEDCHGGR
jgi:WD40 repeat protein